MNTFKADCSNLSTTRYIANILSIYLKQRDIICFYGDVGSGKTTFIRFLIECLYKTKGITPPSVSSPTFSIVNEYNILDIEVAHFDLYRIDTIGSLEQVGIDEYLEQNLCLIEWPQIADSYLPDNFLKVSLNLHDDIREITLQAVGEYSMDLEMIEELKKLSKDSNV